MANYEVDGKRVPRLRDRQHQEDKQAGSVGTIDGKVKYGYSELLGPSPIIDPNTDPQAKIKMWQWIEHVTRVIEHGGWVAGERSNLKRMRRKWRARLQGRDEYFNKWGNGCRISELNKLKRAMEEAKARAALAEAEAAKLRAELNVRKKSKG